MITKDWYTLFKKQINVKHYIRKDDVKAEDCVKRKDEVIIDNVQHRYIGDE